MALVSSQLRVVNSNLDILTDVSRAGPSAPPDQHVHCVYVYVTMYACRLCVCVWSSCRVMVLTALFLFVWPCICICMCVIVSVYVIVGILPCFCFSGIVLPRAMLSFAGTLITNVSQHACGFVCMG
jgi:hypothetical protein